MGQRGGKADVDEHRPDRHISGIHEEAERTELRGGQGDVPQVPCTGRSVPGECDFVLRRRPVGALDVARHLMRLVRPVRLMRPVTLSLRLPVDR